LPRNISQGTAQCFSPQGYGGGPDRQALAMHHRYCEPLLCVPAYRGSKLISAMLCPVTNTMFWYREYAPPVPQSNGYSCSWWPPGFTDSTNIDPPRVFVMQFIPGTSSCRDLEVFSHGHHERGGAHGRGGGGSRGGRGMIYPAWHNIPRHHCIMFLAAVPFLRCF
jgi:hypothetical protein